MTFRQRAARLPEVVAPVITGAPASDVPSMDELMAKRRRRPAKQPEAVPTPTFAMLTAAAESDMREAFPAHYDADEAAECGVSLLCAAELALAQD